MEKENTKSLSAYERILNTAEDLFYQEGIQSVGIDKIIKEAGVAMSTLYKYFPSKDKLIESADRYGKSTYGQHLKKVAEGKYKS